MPSEIDSQFIDVLAACRNSTKLFAQTFFPERFPRPFTKLHDEIFRVLDDDSIKQAVVVAPRGIGKTTLISEIYPLKRILFRDSHYIISLGASEATATEQTENIKLEIQNNDLVRSTFGDFSETRLSKEEWILKFDDGDMVKVMPRGAGQAVRGRRFGRYRPQLVLVDDLENDKHMKSELQRTEKKQWFFSSLKNIVDIYGSDWRIIVVGTIMHEDSLLANLLELPDWHKVIIPIADENMHSNIPEWNNDEWILNLKKTYMDAGEVDKFYMEFMCTVIAGEHASFQKEFFKYYEEEEINQKPWLETVIMGDPARSTKERSNDSALMAISIDGRNDCLYIRDTAVGRYEPEEFYVKMLEMADRYNAVVLAPETTGLNNYATYMLKEAMIRRYKGRVPYPIANNGEGLKPIKSKPDRARALISWYKRGAIRHNPAVCSSLEASLLSYPRCKLWDLIDCLSNAIDVMDEGDRFLGIGKGNFDVDEMEDEFRKLELDAEPPLDLNWTII